MGQRVFLFDLTFQDVDVSGSLVTTKWISGGNIGDGSVVFSVEVTNALTDGDTITFTTSALQNVSSLANPAGTVTLDVSVFPVVTTGGSNGKKQWGSDRHLDKLACPGD